MTPQALRKTGIDLVGDIPWGTHFCHFFETKEDLLDTVLPYFRAGLEARELCIWMVAEPLTPAEAMEKLRLAVPHLDRHRCLDSHTPNHTTRKGQVPNRRRGRVEIPIRGGTTT